MAPVAAKPFGIRQTPEIGAGRDLRWPL